MRLLEGSDMENTRDVATRVNELAVETRALAEELRAKLDYLFERMDSIEGVGRDKAEPADWDDEGDPGECPECGAPYQIVRPGKVQSSCRCDEVRQLTEELAELRRRLAEKPVGLLAENERLTAERDGLRRHLRAIETWEAAVIEDNDCWHFSLPMLTQELLDRWMTLQGERNALLGRAKEGAQCDAPAAPPGCTRRGAGTGA